MQNTYNIDKKIPLPGRARRISRTARIRNTLARLEVGDSFSIPKSDWGNASKPRYVVPYREAYDAGIKITFEVTNRVIRIWRIR